MTFFYRKKQTMGVSKVKQQFPLKLYLYSSIAFFILVMPVFNDLRADSLEESEFLRYSVNLAPQYEGGQGALQTFLTENLKYPHEAQGVNFGGNYEIRVKIDVEGKASLVNFSAGFRSMGGYKSKPVTVVGQRTENTKSKQDDTAGFEALLLEVQRVVELMPTWTPGKKEGQVAETFFIMPVHFKLVGEITSEETERPSDLKSDIVIEDFIRAGRVK